MWGCCNSNGESLQGTSKSGYLGEASIDFADFVAETEPLTVTLPLKFANSGVVLHVSLSYSNFYIYIQSKPQVFLSIHEIKETSISLL